jgi:hypothetical protein
VKREAVDETCLFRHLSVYIAVQAGAERSSDKGVAEAASNRQNPNLHLNDPQ